MSKKGPPPPPAPPPKGGPPKGPPPPPSAKAPLPPISKAAEPVIKAAMPKAKAVKEATLFNLSEAEKIAWVASPEGLSLSALKMKEFYPNEGLLIKFKIAPLKAGKPIPKDELNHKTLFERELKAEITRMLMMLFTIDANIAKPYLDEIEKKASTWKQSNGGLNDAYEYLAKKMPLLQQALFAENLKKNDPDYKHHLTQSEELKAAFAEKLASYHAADEEEKRRLFPELQAIIQKLDLPKKQIMDHTAPLRTNEAILAQALAVRQKRIDDIETQIDKLSKDNERFEKAIDPDGEFKQEIEKNSKKIAELRHLADNPSPDVVEKEDKEIAQAQNAVKEVHQKQMKSEVLRALYNPPAEWLQLQRKTQDSKPQSKEKKARDITGLASPDPLKPEIDLQFLPFDALIKVARFFAVDFDTYETYVKDRVGLVALMERVNTSIRFNEHLNFNTLVDIGAGKIKRNPREFASNNPKDLFHNIVENIVISTDKAAWLKRSQNHYNHLDPVAFKKYAEERGISVDKAGTYYNYKRKIDLDYLTPTQLLNLANFFARKEKEFLTEQGLPNEKELISHVKTVFANTSLSYEELMSIAEGTMAREVGKYAPQDSRKTLQEVKIGSEPDYGMLIAQRKAFYENKKRAEEEKRIEAEQQRLAAIEAAKVVAEQPLSEERGSPRSESPASVSSRVTPEVSPQVSPRASLQSKEAPPPVAALQPSMVVPPILLKPGAHRRKSKEKMEPQPKSTLSLEAPPLRPASAHAPKQRATTNLGIPKMALFTQIEMNKPDVFLPLLAKKGAEYERGRSMEAKYHALKFLHNPDVANMKELFNSAHRSSVLVSFTMFDPPDEAALKELKELGISLHYSKDFPPLNKDKPIKEFLEQLEARVEKDPFYKLMILKGHLLLLQEKYGPNYKMGALTKHLIDGIHTTTLENIGPNDRLSAEALLNADKCKAEYQKFKIDYDLAEKSSKQKPAPRKK